MQLDFEQEWRTARTHELNGKLAEAKAIYDALIAAGPDRLYVRLRLSVLEQAFGNYRAAREHALKAGDTAVRKGRWKDLASVTRRLLTFDEHGVVRDLITSADWSDPEILRNSAVLSQHLWLIGDVAEALRLIDTARVRAPSSPILSYSRANALRYCGRMEEATAEYEHCLELEPNSAYAHWSLAYHVKASPLGSRIDRIRKAQATFPENAPEQAYLHYALFKEFDDAGEVDLAWHNLQAGARSKRQSTPYDSSLEQQGFDALQDLATDDFVHARTGATSFARVPIFIVGLPRTGTTLLERIVGNHAQVRAGGELNDFNSALCLESNRFIGACMLPSVIDQVRDIDFSQVGRLYMQRTDDKAGDSSFLVDKNPMNFAYAGFIGKALPQARILCLRRAPMDACLSNLKELFSNDAYGYSYDLDELADHYLRFSRLCDHWQQVMPEQFLVVDYEALVSDPEATSAQVMDFCGIPFEPESVDITKNYAPVSTASSSQVRQPINTRGIGAWRKYAEYLAPLESRLHKALPSSMR